MDYLITSTKTYKKVKVLYYNFIKMLLRTEKLNTEVDPTPPSPIFFTLISPN